MTEPGRYPFGLDADTLLEVAGRCWLAHDGQWFLKVADRDGLEPAMRLNERAMASIARIELRELKRVAGTASFDSVGEVADFYRLLRYVFGGRRLPPCRTTVVDADTLVVVNQECLGAAIAERSGYGHLRTGEYPPCLGWMERQRAWGEAFSDRYRFTVEREPTAQEPCRYVVRRQKRGSVPD